MQRLGIEHILGHSPKARGRSERANRTLQDRIVNELRLGGIATPSAATRYLEARFLAAYDAAPPAPSRPRPQRQRRRAASAPRPGLATARL